MRIADRRAGGAVFIETLLIIPIFLFLFAALTDFFRYQRVDENLLPLAVSSGLRAIVRAPEWAGSDQTVYARARFRRGIETARYTLEENGLDPDNFNYVVTTILRSDPVGQQTFAVQFNISAQAGVDWYYILPVSSFGACFGASTTALGVLMGDGFSEVDGIDDPNCRPQS